MIAIIDIDGVIADCTHRLHYLATDPKDWDAFFDAMVNDTPIPNMRDFVRAIAGSYRIVYLTGRPTSHFKQTVAWLSDYGFPYGELIMRETGDHRPDYEVKKELFETKVRDQMGIPCVCGGG